MKHTLLGLGLACFLGIVATAGPAAAAAPRFQFHEGDRVVFVGDDLAERMQEFNYFETLLQSRFPELKLTFRNLGWSADTPSEQPRPLNFGDMPTHLTAQKADVIFLMYGMTASFDGQAGLEKFEKGLDAQVKDYAKRKFNGKSAPRLVLFSPIAHERLGGDLPDPTKHNEDLKLYTAAIGRVAAANGLPFVDVFTPTLQHMNEAGGDHWTINGIHLTPFGDWAFAHFAYQGLFGTLPQAWIYPAGEDPQGRVVAEKSLPLAPPAGAKVSARLAALVQQYPGAKPKSGTATLFCDDVPSQLVSAKDWLPGFEGPILRNTPAHAAAEKLRDAVAYKNQQFFYRWHAVNGEYIYGRRKEPFGIHNFPAEMAKLDELTAEGDAKIFGLNKPKTERVLRLVEGDRMPPAKPLSKDAGPSSYEIYHQEHGLINGRNFPTAADPEEARKLFHLADGYEVNLFASEKEFPLLQKPVSMQFDSKGRLWVGTNPSYPQAIPGIPPDDKLIILEDTKGAGKADKCAVFADHLYMPLGLEFGEGGVYVSEQPTLAFLKDTDGDGKADTRKTLLQGLGTGDSHHACHAFNWGPDGGLYFGDGTFHVTNVESPYGPMRLNDAGWIRFEPRAFTVQAFVSYPFANPWGQVFDRWGQNFIADASGGANYFGLPITGRVEHPNKHPGMKVFTSTVRPTCGCEIVSSRQFPDDAQGDFLVNNCIGFQGIKRHKIIEEGSGFTSKEMPPLLYSTDPNFRPVAIQFGPDGALYIADWYNPLVGHMQFSIRDPNRDHVHGRIWRITAKGRPLVTPAKIDGTSVAGLLDLLKSYEDRTRYRVRRELRDRPTEEVVAALKTWVAGLDATAADYEHNLLEALWVYQTKNVVEPGLLATVLKAKDYHARAGAVRVLRFWHDKVADAAALFRAAANDANPRVRLEAVVALSYVPTAEAASIALESLKQPLDYYLDYGLKETMKTLEPQWKAALASGKPFAQDNPAGANFVLGEVSSNDLVKMSRSAPVYVALLNREGVLPQYRTEALTGLAKINNTDPMKELLAAMGRLDAGHMGHGGHVLHDLAQLLITQPRGDLVKARESLDQLAMHGHDAATREAAYAALVTADGSLEKVWKEAAGSIKSLRDLVEALPLIPDPAVRASAYGDVAPLARRVPEPLSKLAGKDKGVTGRYVRISLPGAGRTLTLAEVEVISRGVNIAPKGKAKQSSTGYGGGPERAIDGNTSGSWVDNTSTHTAEGGQDPWWEVDLGAEKPLDAVVVWNRTDGELGMRLDGFMLTVLDAHRHPTFTRMGVSAPATSVRIPFGDDPVKGLRRAAIGAITALPGHDGETFTMLAGFVKAGDERDAAVQALRRLPRSAWPKDEVKPLLAAVIDYVGKLPPDERTEAAGLDAFQLGNDLASLLPTAEAKAARAKLGDLGVQVVLIRTLPHRMAYDRTKVYVEAGKPVVLVLENPDIMPHNLIIGTPGSLAEIGLASEKMALDPDALARNYIPRNAKVLHATRLLAPQESQRLSFTTPKTPGDYPYLCTFPGHWRVMYGTMKVVAKLDDVPAEELNAPPASEGNVAATRPFVRQWTVEDLTADLDQLDRNRSFERGKALFTAATCVQCHKVGGEGGVIGPDFAELGKKLAEKKMTRPEVLREVIHPSAVIDPKYRTLIVETKAGQLLTGVVVYQDAKVLRLQASPQDKPIEVKLDDIDTKTESKISLMPEGLLVTLTKDEILDLLAYVIHNADAKHPAFGGK